MEQTLIGKIQKYLISTIPHITEKQLNELTQVFLFLHKENGRNKLKRAKRNNYTTK